jgi:hypothetical protein
MMKTLSYFALLVFILFCHPIKGISQVVLDSTKLYQVKTLDGNEYLGNIQSEDSSKLVLQTAKLGALTISKNDIKEILRIEPKSVVQGKIWFENPQSSRYFWAPNGYGLRKGEGYYQNVWVLWNQASVGVTDYFSVGAGIIPLFFFGSSVSPAWIVPKFSIPVVKDRFNIGLGAIAGTLLGEGTGFGILYGTGTLGSRNMNATFGLGYGFTEGSMADHPIANLSFMIRTGMRGYLLSENYYFSSDMMIISFGGRSFARTVGIDYGLFIPLGTDIDILIAIPWLGITIPFGKKASTKHD